MTSSDFDRIIIEAYRKAYMKLSEHGPKFDPSDRIKDGKSLLVYFTATQWYQIELALGKRVSPGEIQELIMGVFVGKFKIVKR